MLGWLRSLADMTVWRSRWEQDLRDELRCHIEERADRLVATGIPSHAALRRARVEFGGVEGWKERCREARGARWIDECSRNCLYAARSARRHPGFTAVAVLSLALGIGANLAVFNVLHRLILNKLPVPDSGRLYQVMLERSGFGTSFTHPYPKFELIRDNIDIFTAVFGWGTRRLNLAVGDAEHPVPVAIVSGNYFDALAVRPALGRLIAPQDDEASGAGTVVVSYGLWQDAFGGDPAVVGRSLQLAGTSDPDAAPTAARFLIVGVAPREFTGTQTGVSPSVYLSLPAYERFFPGAREAVGMFWFHVMVRLRPDVPLDAAQTMLRDKWSQLDEPNRVRATRNMRDIMRLEDGSRGYSEVGREFSTAVLVLMGLVAIVFLMACTNLATLFFVRGAGRIREMNTRLALGAGRAQLVRQWMTEYLGLAALGGAAGLLAAYGITDLLLYFVGETDRPWLRFQTSPLVMLLAVALTVVAGLLCGLLPSIRATRARPEALRRAQSTTARDGQGPLAQGVLAVQVASSLVLVVGAVLFAQTLWNLNTTSVGFEKTVVYGIPDWVSARIPRDQWEPEMQRALERLKASPLLAAVSAGSPPMIWGDGIPGWVVGISGYALTPEESNIVGHNLVMPGYFDALKIPLVVGRDFEERDRPAADEVATLAIINETMARHYFANRNPVGEKFTWSWTGTTVEIIGVVTDTKNTGPRQAGKDQTYMPLGIGGDSAVIARPRPGVEPETVKHEIVTAFKAISPQLPVETGLLEDAVQRSIRRDRLVAQLSAALAILGVLLASIGLYATIAHWVATRTREIGIRVAMGALAHDVIWMVLKRSVFVTAIGLLVGLPMAIAGGRLVRSLLFEVPPSGAVTLSVSATVLALTGLLAAWWPARRAARLDPAQTLRCE